MAPVLYVYAIGVALDLDALRETEGVDRTTNFVAVDGGGVRAVCSEVDSEAFSQDEIDRRGKDMEWLGAIVYRHESVMARLSGTATIIPLRAFTMFSGAEPLRGFLEEESEALLARLDRLAGREEWTVQVEFDPEAWSEAIVQRVDSLQQLSTEISGASEGRAFLLRKKLEEQKKQAARDAEQSVIEDIRSAILAELPDTPVLVESRQQKSGSFPQLNVLLLRDQSEGLQQACDAQQAKLGDDGVRLTLTGPWPPYSFAAGEF